MSPKLKNYVHLLDEDGNRVILGPRDEVPEWARKRITNPDAWDVAPVDAVAVDPALVAPVAAEPAPAPAPAPKKRPARAKAPAPAPEVEAE